VSHDTCKAALDLVAHVQESVESVFQRPEPPESLSAEAKENWPDVVSCFRPNWFLGSEAVLVAYVQTIAIERQVASMLGQAEVGSKPWRQLIQLYLGVCVTLISTATKLRITPRSTRDS
jgi:hypothetical protein